MGKLKKGPLCMGNEETALVHCYYLMKRLMDGFEILSSIQQTPIATDKKESWLRHKHIEEDGIYELEEITKEIAMALTGKTIQFNKKKNNE